MLALRGRQMYARLLSKAVMILLLTAVAGSAEPARKPTPQTRKVDQYGRDVCAKPFAKSECVRAANTLLTWSGERQAKGGLVMLRVKDEETGREGWMAEASFETLDRAQLPKRPSGAPLNITPRR